jgi:GT2 family glycosyltransferase
MLTCRSLNLSAIRTSGPWLSVVMPTYNGTAYVAAALESVRLENDPGIEVIVVDDGSTDDTVRIVRSFAGDLDLRVAEGARRGNWVAATNAGLALSRGDYVSLLHQDDLWLEGRLRHLRRMLAGTPGAALIVHPSVFIDGSGARIGTWGCPLPPVEGEVPASLFLERLLVQNFLAIAAPIFRREAVQKLGGLDETLWYTADWDLWLKLAAQGPPLFCPRPLAAFRVHDASQTASRAGESDGLRSQMLSVLERHLPQRAGEVEAAARFSVELNTALGSASAGGSLPWHLAGRFLALGPRGWRRYLRDSRIGERLGARLRARARGARAAAARQGSP